LFARHGYSATPLDDVRAAGGTTGTPYHHFPNKLELFAAVYEQEQQRLAELFIAAHSTRSDDQDGLEGGFRAFLEASRDPGVQRITLLDAPSVLGWERLRVIEDRYTIAMLRVALEQAVATGVFDDRPVEPLVQMLNGALRKEALLIARSENQEEVTEQVLLELRVWFGVLRKRTQLI
jgi:AcrR family transcriptional regulator